MIETQLEELVRQRFLELEWSDCFLLSVKISPKKMVEITIDADAGVTFEQCQKLSRHVENWLDTEGVLGDEYTLEVSSPGADKPLKLPRQFPRNIGRTLDIVNTEGSKFEGKLTAADAEKLTLEIVETRKEGKQKIVETRTVELPFDKIKSATVQIKF